MKNLLFATISATLLLTAVPTSRADEKYPPEFTAAIAAYEAKDYEKAEKQFRAALSRRTSVTVQGQLRFNLGVTLREAKKHDEAVRVFQSILSSRVNDRDPGDNLMEEFRNYRYRSCLQIAMCYHAQGKIPKALEYAELARDKYRYQAHCGTCEEQAKASLDRYFRALRAKAP